MPQISVIVPVYKVEKYLRRCVNSILKQSFQDFELILVDDGSPDNCGTICEQYALQDSRVHVIHQKNRGLSAARNAGIDWAFEKSDSEWFSFIDSDDWVRRDYLEVLYRCAKEADTEVAIGGYVCSHGDDPFSNGESFFSRRVQVEEFYCQENTTATTAWGTLYKKECFNDIRYPVGKIHEDEYVTYKILFQYDYVGIIEEPIYAYFQNPDGITGTQWGIRNFDVLCALQNQLKFFRENHFLNAYKQQTEIYAMRLLMACNVLRQIPNTRVKEWQMKFTLKCLLLKNWNWYSVKGHEQVYKRAFPLFMELYWIIRSQVIKLERMNGR